MRVKKVKKTSESSMRGDIINKLIKLDSPLRLTKKQFLNNPTPELAYYIKQPYPS